MSDHKRSRSHQYGRSCTPEPIPFSYTGVDSGIAAEANSPSGGVGKTSLSLSPEEGIHQPSLETYDISLQHSQLPGVPVQYSDSRPNSVTNMRRAASSGDMPSTLNDVAMPPRGHGSVSDEVDNGGDDGALQLPPAKRRSVTSSTGSTVAVVPTGKDDSIHHPQAQRVSMVAHDVPSREARAQEDRGSVDVERTSKDYYFDSYAHHAIHEEMLKDEVRTRTYEMAIMQNKHLFQDKIVLDVGCGTGILSMFAAQAGAKQVYAVDCSAIIEQARQIVQLNGFEDRVTLIKGKVEEIELPVDKVDIIISEWMGYFLLYESMLNTVLYARDKWLVPNGILFPDKAVMYLTAVEDGNVKRDRFDFWDDVYGFDMTPIKQIAIREPVVDVVDAKALVTDSVPILHLDILTCTKEDLEFSSKFKLQAQRNDYIHGLVAYFECAFTQIHKPIGFSTAPFARYTHWKQTILYLEEAITICAGETVQGEISCKPNKRNCRDLDIGLILNVKGRYSEVNDRAAHYRLR